MDFNFAYQADDTDNPGEVPADVNRVCLALMQRHGQGDLRQEANGLHFYLPSPKCLEEDGEIELSKKHLTVNLDRYLGRGAFASQRGTYNGDNSAWCHKTDTRYLISELLMMSPLAERGIRASTVGLTVKMAADREKFCINDLAGNLIPDHPGMAIPITALGPGHHAYDYLTSRGYDPVKLYAQYRVGYCTTEQMMTGLTRRGYRDLPMDFKDTPQGRLIFYIDVKGVQQGWQARIIDRQIMGGLALQHWHPYRDTWVTTHFRSAPREKWQPSPELFASIQAAGLDDRGLPKLAWDPSKYYTGKGTLKSTVVMGYDAAVRWNLERQTSTGVLAEGPLDGGRPGPPGMAMLGKYLNDAQARLLAESFRRILYVNDTDLAGIKAQDSVQRAFIGKPTDLQMVDVRLFHNGESRKDLGEADERKSWEILAPLII